MDEFAEWAAARAAANDNHVVTIAGSAAEEIMVSHSLVVFNKNEGLDPACPQQPVLK